MDDEEEEEEEEEVDSVRVAVRWVDRCVGAEGRKRRRDTEVVLPRGACLSEVRMRLTRRLGGQNFPPHVAFLRKGPFALPQSLPLTSCVEQNKAGRQ